MSKNKLKYILYARKSCESEDRQYISIDSQIQEMKALAERNNITISEVIQEAQSAKQPGRRGFNRMIHLIRKGEAQGIITWKLNRLSRNPIDGGLVTWLLQQQQIHSIITSQRTYQNADSLMMMNIEFGFAQQYLQDLSTDIKRGLRNRAFNGWYPGKLPPAYMRRGGSRHDPRASEIILSPHHHNVRTLWTLFLQGNVSYRELHRTAHAFGMKISRSSLHRVFSNEFYRGYYSWRDEQGIPQRTLGNHPPLITESEWILASKIRGKRRGNYTHKKTKHLLSGILRCSLCSYMLIREEKKRATCTKCKHRFSCMINQACSKCDTSIQDMNKPHIYTSVLYRCGGRKYGCKQPYLKESTLIKLILSQIESWSISLKLQKLLSNMLTDKKVIEFIQGMYPDIASQSVMYLSYVSKAFNVGSQEEQRKIIKLIDVQVI